MKSCIILPAVVAALLSANTVLSLAVNTHQARSNEVGQQKVERGSVLGGILDPILDPIMGWPSCSWQCNESGQDGWGTDCYGNGPPSGCPSGWKWYGSDKGWCPPKGWQEPPSCVMPSWWQPAKCPWWSTPPTPPSPPPCSWQCNDSGNDGCNEDCYGHGPPQGCPSGWQWFGSNKGWCPPTGWQEPPNCDWPSWWQPSICPWW